MPSIIHLYFIIPLILISQSFFQNMSLSRKSVIDQVYKLNHFLPPLVCHFVLSHDLYHVITF